MPGIVGIIGSGFPEEKKAALGLMVKCLLHEPTYLSGIYVNEDLGIWIGWANRPESFSVNMPIWNEKKDICLIFSGETYTDLEEISHLQSQGHEYAKGDANYLVHLYEEFGIKSIEKWNGRFSGVIIDLRLQSIFLFNDRYGLNRIYYREDLRSLFFSSEAKSLLKVLPGLRRLDPISLAETFSFGAVLQNRTIFQGLSLVPGGSLWAFYPKQAPKKGFYFRPELWENQEPLDNTQYFEKLKRTWARILPRYLRGEENIALSLTGGKDSRMILAWMPSQPGTLPCYTFGGLYRDCRDVKIARKLAGICQQPFQVISVDRKFLSEFPFLSERTVYLTDGALDVSAAPDLYVNRTARHTAPIRLTGNYGQEILRSEIAFKPRPLFRGMLEGEFNSHVINAAQTYTRELANNKRSFVAFKQIPWHHYARLALELTQITVRSPFLDNELVALTYQSSCGLATGVETQLRLIAEGNPALVRIGTDRAILFKPVPLLTWVERLYQEFTYKAEYAYDYGMPSLLTKIDKIAKPLHIERLFLGKHKFSHFRIWYRDELSGYIKDILLDSRSRSRPYLEAGRLEEVIVAHTKGRANYTSEIHRFLTAELIQRLFID